MILFIGFLKVPGTPLQNFLLPFVFGVVGDTMTGPKISIYTTLWKLCEDMSKTVSLKLSYILNIQIYGWGAIAFLVTCNILLFPLASSLDKTDNAK